MKIYTVSEAAKILRLGESSVYELVSQEKIGHFEVGPKGGGIRISQSDIDDYLASCRKEKKGGTPKKVSTPRLKHLKL